MKCFSYKMTLVTRAGTLFMLLFVKAGKKNKFARLIYKIMNKLSIS